MNKRTIFLSKMRRQRILTAMVLACGLAGPVQAEILASGPVYGGPSQNHVACSVFNANSDPITFVRTDIFDQTSLDAIPLTFNNCGASLAPGDQCNFQTVANNQGYACKVIINEGKENIRGTMIALDPSNTVLSEADLR
jgi:hypothetical protein